MMLGIPKFASKWIANKGANVLLSFLLRNGNDPQKDPKKSHDYVLAIVKKENTNLFEQFLKDS